MLKQYLRIKTEIEDKDTILFFRLGDFYEMFFEDALTASGILDITLTSRNKNDPNPVPLCGIPYHSAEPYIAKLISSGKKVAICEQVEDPKKAKGVVKREIVKIITPGVRTEPETLNASRNNYLAAAIPNDGGIAFAISDVSTGHFKAGFFHDIKEVEIELSRLEPSEIIIPGAFSSLQIPANAVKTIVDNKYFNAANLPRTFADGADPRSFSAVGAILSYVEKTQKSSLPYLKKAEPYRSSEFMVIDETAKRNLELCQTLADGSLQGSLIWLLGHTKTAMGARTLRRWMLYPLMDKNAINERLDGIADLIENADRRHILEDVLAHIADIERMTARITAGSANARELSALKSSLKNIPKLKFSLCGLKGILAKAEKHLDDCEELMQKIEDTLVDEPPLSIHDGGLIKQGVSKELDTLRAIATDGKGFIARLETTERQRTGINSLKVRYNRVFGYYIEVTHTHSEKIPSDYIRKQTLVNAERFITPELKEYEEKVTSAEERSKQAELELFNELRSYAANFADRLIRTAEAIGGLDTILSLAHVAGKNRYVRPSISENGEISITEGRHPIIEVLNPVERFVPNSLCLNDETCRMMMITGPNMAGKSTVMRQTALIVLMAQMGSFVPAKEASICMVDRIFTRVGASDNLIKGQSTFMVEMNETAAILKEATLKSLILIDEIGRGTSTYDGVSIAWAVAEYIYDMTKAKTLFATHYHELTDLSLEREGIQNYNVAVKEWGDKVIFLRKLVPGGADRSYGIQVARLAGLPDVVVKRAKEILSKLEIGELELKPPQAQMPLFNFGKKAD